MVDVGKGENSESLEEVVFFRDWKTGIVLILYKSQAPKSVWGNPRKFQLSDSTTCWSSHLLPCIKRFTNRTLHAPQHNGTNFWNM